MTFLAQILNLLPHGSRRRHAHADPSLERSLNKATSGALAGKIEGRANLVPWLIGLRWIAVLSAAAVVAVATLVSNRVDPKSGPYLWAGVLALAAFNMVLGLLGSRQLAQRPTLVVQVAGDVIALGWLVHGAGGLENPFSGFCGSLQRRACGGAHARESADRRCAA